MFKFIFFGFFFIVLMTLLLGFSFLRTLKNILFGSGNKKKTGGQRQAKQKQTTQQASSNKAKIFRKDEGEYVDYEEVKD